MLKENLKLDFPLKYVSRLPFFHYDFRWKRPILDSDPTLPNFSSELESNIDPDTQVKS